MVPLFTSDETDLVSCAAAQRCLANAPTRPRTCVERVADS
jgi:hypothetical protein